MNNETISQQLSSTNTTSEQTIDDVPTLDQMATDSARDRKRFRQGTIEAAWIGLNLCRRVGWAQGQHGLKSGELDNYCKLWLGLSHSDVEGMKRLLPRLDDAEEIVVAWARAGKKRGKCPTWRACLNKLLGPGPRIARAAVETNKDEDGLTGGDADGSELVEGIKVDSLAEENASLALQLASVTRERDVLRAEVARLQAEPVARLYPLTLEETTVRNY